MSFLSRSLGFVHIGPVDLVDVLCVATLVYFVLLGLRRRHVPHALAGLIAFVILVMVARVVGMRLVAFLFGGLVTVILLALVVLFQEELRRFLDWVTVLGVDRGGAPRLEFLGLERTVFDLAEAKTGALIAIEGRLPLTRHVVGGVVLNGTSSDALLKSLFDPHTPGHDGAVVLDDNRIVRFGAHLPLSSRLDLLEGKGTRHAAALGLSERTDAMCVAVSEERGTVSVARGGELLEVAGPEQLLQQLRTHRRARRGLPERRSALTPLRRNLSLKLAALGISAALWFFFVHESELEYRRFTVPVGQVGLGPGLAIEEIEPPRVDVIVSAPRRAFYFLGPDDFAVKLALFGSGSGALFYDLTASEVELPARLAFVSLVPRQVEVRIGAE